MRRERMTKVEFVTFQTVLVTFDRKSQDACRYTEQKISRRFLILKGCRREREGGFYD